MKMTDQDMEFFYQQLKEDISDRATVSVEALRIYFEQSDECNDFTHALACASEHDYFKEITELFKPAKDPVGVIFTFDETNTSYIDTTTKETADETGLFGWVHSYEFLDDKNSEFQESFPKMSYTDQINALHYHKFFDNYMPEGTKQFGSKFVTDGYDEYSHNRENWIPKFMDTCYPVLSRIETTIRLNETLPEKNTKAQQLSNDIEAEDFSYKPATTRTSRAKL
ncbi:hypothetical protein K6L09_21055 [Burkholderia cepacia]